MAAQLGLDVTGIDSSARAIALAEHKANDRNLAPRFLVANALELESRNERYDTVLDCGLFHVFEDVDRSSFVGSLQAIIVPGGRYFMLCFSDQQPGDWGPRRVSRAEIESSFTEGWRIDSIEPSTIDITIDPEGAEAWLVSITRI